MHEARQPSRHEAPLGEHEGVDRSAPIDGIAQGAIGGQRGRRRRVYEQLDARRETRLHPGVEAEASRGDVAAQQVHTRTFRRRQRQRSRQGVYPLSGGAPAPVAHEDSDPAVRAPQEGQQHLAADGARTGQENRCTRHERVPAARCTTSATFCPPNPNEFESAVRNA